jgi:hypothetical protein
MNKDQAAAEARERNLGSSEVRTNLSSRKSEIPFLLLTPDAVTVPIRSIRQIRVQHC